MDLDLALVPGATRGRPSTGGTEATLVRELSPTDIEHLARNPEGVTSETKMRDRHHKLAQACAAGMSDIQAAAVAGYTPTRVSQLRKNTAFIDLVAYYRNEKRGMFEDLGEAMCSLAQDAVNELRDRLEEKPESFKVPELLEMSSRFADRTGFGPKATMKHEHTFDLASRLQKARERINEAKVIDHEVLGPLENSDG